jgi:hypothetical protein
MAARSSQDFACCCEGTLETRLRFGRIGHRQLERDFAGRAMDFDLPPPLFRCVHRRHGIAITAPSIIELTEF